MFLPAQPAGRVRDELAFRGDRGEVRRVARRQDRPADRQRAAAPPQVTPGVGRLSRLVSRARAEHPNPLRSYSQDLADKLARDCRRIITSDWYQRLFGITGFWRCDDATLPLA